LHGLTKIGQWKIGKTLPGLMSMNFCCDIQMVVSEFGANNMKASVFYCTLQAAVGGGVLVLGDEYCC